MILLNKDKQTTKQSNNEPLVLNYNMNMLETEIISAASKLGEHVSFQRLRLILIKEFGNGLMRTGYSTQATIAA